MTVPLARPVETLAVDLYGTHVADLTRGRSAQRVRWDWTAEAPRRWGWGARVVSHGLTIGEPVTELSAGVFVDGLLPEGNLRTHLAVDAGVEPDDLFGLLARYGRDTAGALDFRPQPPPRRTNAEPVPLRAPEVRELLDRVEATQPALTSMSLAGFVPKIALGRAEDGTWMLPPAGVPSTWILKIAHGGAASDVVDTEAMCLDLGRRVGVTTVQGSVLDIDGRRVIAVSRYDRVVVNGRVERLHQEDLAQILGINTADPARKFQRGRVLPSWQRAGAAIREDGGALGPLARLVAFSFLVGNTDHHAKNTSVLRLPDGRVRVAPAYDIAVHLHHPGPHWTALDLAGGSDYERLTIRDVIEEIRSWGVDQSRAQAVVLDLVDDLQRALREIDRSAHPGVGAEVWTLLEQRAVSARGVLDATGSHGARSWPHGTAAGHDHVDQEWRADGDEGASATEEEMTAPAVVDFDDFFVAMTGHRPYVWQREAAWAIRAGAIPPRVVVPTGFGKTSLMLAWLWALAEDIARVRATPGAVRRVPLRYVLVVDRRLIVDDTAALATRIQTSLTTGDAPAVQAVAGAMSTVGDGDDAPCLEVRELRGGMPTKPENIRHPARPGIIVGTVDLIGSRLLFRGYGVSPERRPIDAALVGLDTMFVLDEAHLARQFAATLGVLDERQAREESRWDAVPARATVVMTATPSEGAAVMDWERESRENPQVAERRACRGATGIALWQGAKGTADDSMPHLMADVEIPRGTTTIIFTNTAKQARACATALRRRDEVKSRAARVALLIGGMPPVTRDAAVAALAAMRTGTSTPLTDDDPALVVVATSTLEVGADLDADRVITPVASRSSLIQRLGRVNRVGARPGCTGVIVLPAESTGATRPTPEPIHGPAANTLAEALRRAQPGSLGELETLWRSSEASSWEAPSEEPAFLPRFDFEAYQRTAGSPNEPEVGRWLRRPDDPRAEVSVVFRRSLDQLGETPSVLAEHLLRCPPRPEEIWTLPLALVRDEVKGDTRLVVLDPAGTHEPVVFPSSPKGEVSPGRWLVLPPTQAAFGMDEAGEDLLEGRPDESFALVRAEDAPGEIPATQQWRRLVDDRGADTGWIEVTPITTHEEPVPSVEYGLDRHLTDVEHRARAWAQRLCLPGGVVDDIALAARLHDEGKRADLTQREYAVTLDVHGALAIGPPPDAPRAKSSLPRRAWRRARRLVGVPAGYRHEAESAVRFDALLAAGEVRAHDALLVRHLVLSHHGYFRGAAPAIDGSCAPAYQDPRDRRWADRPEEFDTLVHRYGPYSLALAEAVVRLADWHESRLITDRVPAEDPT